MTSYQLKTVNNKEISLEICTSNKCIQIQLKIILLKDLKNFPKQAVTSKNQQKSTQNSDQFSLFTQKSNYKQALLSERQQLDKRNKINSILAVTTPIILQKQKQDQFRKTEGSLFNLKYQEQRLKSKSQQSHFRKFVNQQTQEQLIQQNEEHCCIQQNNLLQQVYDLNKQIEKYKLSHGLYQDNSLVKYLQYIILLSIKDFTQNSLIWKQMSHDNQNKTQFFQQLQNSLITLGQNTQIMFNKFQNQTNGLFQMTKFLEEKAEKGISDLDIRKVKEMLIEFTKNLDTFSKIEIESNLQMKSIENLQLENSALKLENKQKQKQIECLQTKQNDQKNINYQNKSINEELNKKNQNLNQHIQLLKNENHSLSNKLDGLLKMEHTKKIDSNISIHFKELIKENDNHRRAVESKNKEIEKLNENIDKLYSKNQRLQKKLDQLQQRKNQKRLQTEEDEDLQIFGKKKIEVKQELPESLHFRTQNLPKKSLQLLHDIEEYGPSLFTQQILQPNQQLQQMKKSIKLISQQYASFKDFAEKLHYFMKQCEFMININSLQELQRVISRNIRPLFLADNVHLWILEYVIFQLILIYIEQSKIIRMKQLKQQRIQESLKKYLEKEKLLTVYILFLNDNQKQVLEEKQITLYNNLSMQEKEVIASKGLFFPIIIQEKIFGVFEVFYTLIFFYQIKISNITESINQNDFIYLGIACLTIIKGLIQQILERNIFLKKIEQENFLYNAFNDICKSLNQFEFAENTKKWVSLIFGVQTTHFLFVNNNKFLVYNSKDDVKIYDIQGMSGMVYHKKQQLVFTNSCKSSIYQEKLDLISLLPVFYMPILEKKEEGIEIISNQAEDQLNKYNVYAVLSFVLKCSTQINVKKEDMEFYQGSNIIKPHDHIQAVADLFGEMLTNAYLTVKKIF